MTLIVNLNSLKMCALKYAIILFLIFMCLPRISRPTCSVSKKKKILQRNMEGLDHMVKAGRHLNGKCTLWSNLRLYSSMLDRYTDS